MAPPRHRGRGFSRRIQYGLFVGYVVAIVGIVAGLGLVLVARFDPVAFQGIRGLALDLTSPATAVFGNVGRGADEIGGGLSSYLDAARQNRALRAELEATANRLIQARATEYENARLKRLLHVVERGTQPIVVARLIGSDAANHRRTVTLAAGTSDGVRAGQPVRGPGGLVGRVAEAGARVARVLLVSDGGSSVPVRVARTGQPALVAGKGDGTVEIKSTQLGAPPLHRGDLLFTSGTGGVFPAGVPVAVVLSVSGDLATGRPLAEPARLDVAMVLPEVELAPPPAAPVGSAN
ncbi:rod shape-determining protein MreC [Sphingomonas sp. BIUV-7]|uniref:Cell shape-determining protein MreC n=1 Tax=Sphingomonas natans TaxID=3063330 RepID=A0ABT8YAX2_9SPHN|nr:rod shape-determining protein MreC [Sphingomonas sp. BIUV-7]MDO6415465.1 rod shape-determining protein MreC [Sphingomonas sp. BIUV-7]